MNQDKDVTESILLALDALVEGVNDLKEQMTALIMAVQLQGRKRA